MRRALTHAMIWLVLAACLVCTVLQMFDRWDHELQTGQDTESAVFVFALCIGAMFVVLPTVVRVYRPSRSRRAKRLHGRFGGPLETLVHAVAAVTLSPSPPVNLRI